MKPRAFALVVLSCMPWFTSLTPFAGAAVLMNETFTFADGNLNGIGGWAASGSAGIKPIQIIANEVRSESSPTDGEDCDRTFTAQSSTSKTYLSFRMRVPSTGPSGAAIVEQPINSVVSLKSAGGTLRAVVGVGIKQGSGDYTVQLFPGTGVVSLVWNDLEFDTDYTVVAAYDAASGQQELWVDPVRESSSHLEVSEAASAGTSVDRVSLRQRNVTLTTRCYHFVDDLRIGTTFADVYDEPAVPMASPLAAGIASLMLMAAGSFVVHRRPLVTAR